MNETTKKIAITAASALVAAVVVYQIKKRTKGIVDDE